MGVPSQTAETLKMLADKVFCLEHHLEIEFKNFVRKVLKQDHQAG